MKPSDLLPLASEAIGVEVEPHQLRAILRRFDQVFEGKAEHGMWGLTAEGANIQLEESSSEDVILIQTANKPLQGRADKSVSTAESIRVWKRAQQLFCPSLPKVGIVIL